MVIINNLLQNIETYIGGLEFSKLSDILLYNPKEPLLFSSGAFLFIFLVFMIGYYCLRKKVDGRLLFVTLFSYYFFYKSSGFYFLLLLIVTVSDFYIARRVAKGKYPRLWLCLSLLIDLGLLAYFKYTNFFAGMVAQMIGGNFQPWDIFLPAGISFYTFKTISYVVDIYRKKAEPMESLLDYAFFVSFFPTLLAGLSLVQLTLVHRFVSHCILAVRCLLRVCSLSLLVCLRRLLSLITSLRTSLIVSLITLHSSLVVRFSLVFMVIAYRFIATSQAILIWQSVLPCFLDLRYR